MKVLVAVLVIVFLVLQYRLWIGEGSLPEVWQLEKQLEKQRQENEALRKRNRALEAEVEDLKQGLEAIEERARDELGMVREDEVFYQIVEDPKGEKPSVPDNRIRRP